MNHEFSPSPPRPTLPRSIRIATVACTRFPCSRATCRLPFSPRGVCGYQSRKDGVEQCPLNEISYASSAQICPRVTRPKRSFHELLALVMPCSQKYTFHQSYEHSETAMDLAEAISVTNEVGTTRYLGTFTLGLDYPPTGGIVISIDYLY